MSERSTGIDSPDTMNTQRNDLLRVVVATCCLVASSDEIDAMQVFTPRQPVYLELMHFRAVAESHGCTMTVRRSEGFVLRFHAVQPPMHRQDGCRGI